MRSLGWIAVVLPLVAGGAFAADKKPEPSETNWASRPTAEEFSAARADARRTGVFTRAVVRCGVADDGVLTDCEVIRETPVGSGFGKAVLALTPKYRRKPPGPGDSRQIQIVQSWFRAEKPADWLRRPTPSQLLAVFPSEAFKKGISGSAMINCVVTVQGALNECVTLEETPADMAFGAAAIALTPQFLMKPATLDNTPVVSVASIPVNFKMDGRGGSSKGNRKVMPANLAWAEAPTFVQMAAAYPKKARDERRGGRATLACAMTEAGRLKDCQVVTYDPKNYGFDAAAKQLARLFAYPIGTDGDRKATHEILVQLPFTFDPAALDSVTPVVGRPTWAAIPDDAQLRSVFADLQLTGTVRVMLSCVVQASGFVAGCSVVSEDPAGAGVGAAALKLAPAFRLSTWTTEGLPVVGGTIRIPLRYEPGPTPAP